MIRYTTMTWNLSGSVGVRLLIDQSREDVKVPLKKEEVDVTKQPYVKEEVSVKKKPVTETRQVSVEVRSERVNVSGSSSSEEEE
jgi:uncharacterized protein (TIGR02271 family)